VSGDRLAEIEELRRSGQLGAITVSDVLALVEIAKAAREAVDAYPNHNAALAAALARLDSGAAEEDA
jgi:hypothetical protein